MWWLVLVFLLCLQVSLQLPVLNTPDIKLFPDTSECGVFHSAVRKIKDGEDAQLGEFPWLAALEYRDKNKTNTSLGVLCGGSLITKRFVLTAVHCIESLQNKELFQVRLGEWNIVTDPDCYDPSKPDECSEPPQLIAVQKTIVHPNYNKLKNQNDIGLVFLEEEAVYTQFVAPICLPFTDKVSMVNNTRSLTVAGWGVTGYDEKSPDVLQKASINYINNDDCKELITDWNVNSMQFCAGDFEKDACNGDSGGPLMKLQFPRWYLVGVVGFGLGCIPEVPGVTVYTRVSSYIPWINNTVMNEYLPESLPTEKPDELTGIRISNTGIPASVLASLVG